MGTKGGGWEWGVARRLSLWLTGGQDDSQLVRSRGSGSWATQRHKRNKRTGTQVGDLADNGPAGEQFLETYMVECKAYKDEPDLYRLWTHTNPVLIGWWRKAVQEATEHNLVPLLVAKRNFRPPLVATPPGLLLGATYRVVIAYGLDQAFELVTLDDFVGLNQPWEVVHEAPHRVLHTRSQWQRAV